MPPIKKREGAFGIAELLTRQTLTFQTQPPEAHPDYLVRVLTQSALKEIVKKTPDAEKKVASMMAQAVITDLTVFVSGLESKDLFEYVFKMYLASLKKRGGGGSGDNEDAAILQGP